MALGGLAVLLLTAETCAVEHTPIPPGRYRMHLAVDTTETWARCAYLDDGIQDGTILTFAVAAQPDGQGGVFRFDGEYSAGFGRPAVWAVDVAPDPDGDAYDGYQQWTILDAVGCRMEGNVALRDVRVAMPQIRGTLGLSLGKTYASTMCADQVPASYSSATGVGFSCHRRFTFTAEPPAP